MAFRHVNLLRLLRNVTVARSNVSSTAVIAPSSHKVQKPKQYKTENDLVYLEDPDTFGTLSDKTIIQDDKLEDEDDQKEQQYLQNMPLRSQKLTTKQYADLIKQYVQLKRYKEAIDILEVRMLKQDRVKPENYIYNILIGACAEVGYTKKAFMLFNDMKRRGLQPTGDTYTCLFEACSNSPWTADGLQRAKNLRELMAEKNIEPNLTNYNAMIKAFGRCGDVATAFQIADEMASKKIKIRNHTFNHLLHGCISDKEHGLRHALIVWRKMLKLREKPNIYSFNLMLKCVKECNLGNKSDIEEMILIIQQLTPLALGKPPDSRVENNMIDTKDNRKLLINIPEDESQIRESKDQIRDEDILLSTCNIPNPANEETEENINGSSAITIARPEFTMEIVEKTKNLKTQERVLPNLLSKIVKMEQVLSLQEVNTPQDKFAIIGGQEDFLKEMEAYAVKPDIKIFTQMLPLIEDSTEAEEKLLETMKSKNINADIDFYNMLIKKRCLRNDYENAFGVMDIIEKEIQNRKKKYHPLNKKVVLKVNIMTYGVLAMACKTKEEAEKLLNEMKEKQLKVNMAILGALLRQGTAKNQYGYVTYIMDIVKEENLKVNDVFLKHLEAFNDKYTNIENKEEKAKFSKWSNSAHKKFQSYYNKWLKEVNVGDVLKPEHPWQQFREPAPETVQRQKTEIVEPKRFYKRNRKYVPYVPRV